MWPLAPSHSVTHLNLKSSFFVLPGHVTGTTKRKLSLIRVSSFSFTVKSLPYSGSPDSRRDSRCQLWAAALRVRHRGLHEGVASEDSEHH